MYIFIKLIWLYIYKIDTKQISCHLFSDDLADWVMSWPIVDDKQRVCCTVLQFIMCILHYSIEHIAFSAEYTLSRTIVILI